MQEVLEDPFDSGTSALAGIVQHAPLAPQEALPSGSARSSRDQDYMRDMPGHMQRIIAQAISQGIASGLRQRKRAPVPQESSRSHSSRHTHRKLPALQ